MYVLYSNYVSIFSFLRNVLLNQFKPIKFNLEKHVVKINSGHGYGRALQYILVSFGRISFDCAAPKGKCYLRHRNTNTQAVRTSMKNDGSLY